MGIGLYIHIPFCLQICPYCDFTTIKNNDKSHSGYIDILIKELETRYIYVGSREIDTIYFGGGTPSLLDPRYIDKTVKHLNYLGFNLQNLQEFTLEVNPGTITQEKLNQYLSIGVNRFSIGVQTFNDKLLKLIGREHSSKDSHNSLSLLEKNNLNYSFDLLYTLGSQSLDLLKHDLNEIRRYSPPHISTYQLNIPKRHRLNLNRPNESQCIEMNRVVESNLSELNYERYELSNWAKDSNYSLHNLAAWNSGQYWGLGISAHSHLKVDNKFVRFWNSNTIKSWENSINDNQSLLVDSNFEFLSIRDQLNDFIHTRLRLKNGFSLEDFSEKFGQDNLFTLKDKLTPLIKSGLILEVSGEIKCTSQGFDLHNLVLEKLFF